MKTNPALLTARGTPRKNKPGAGHPVGKNERLARQAGYRMTVLAHLDSINKSLKDIAFCLKVLARSQSSNTLTVPSDR